MGQPSETDTARSFSARAAVMLLPPGARPEQALTTAGSWVAPATSDQPLQAVGQRRDTRSRPASVGLIKEPRLQVA